jgi:hypothetical protein
MIITKIQDIVLERFIYLRWPQKVKGVELSLLHACSQEEIYKRVEGWITMACHVYDPINFRVMTIVMFDMQVKDVEFQVLMWGAF